jgi:hypothetical protein
MAGHDLLENLVSQSALKSLKLEASDGCHADQRNCSDETFAAILAVCEYRACR